jgi:hypothetical protein
LLTTENTKSGELLILEEISSILGIMLPKKYPINRPMVMAGIGYIVLFILFAIGKSYFPDAGGGWSDPPLIDYLFFLGAGICISILAAGYTYYSWVLTEEEYIQWYTDQQLFGKKIISSWRRLYPAGMIIWTNRILSPILGLVGIAMAIFGLVLIFKFIFDLS